MEVTKGFKKSEFGMLPKDWHVYKMKECCTKITDGTHDTPKPVKTGVPFLTAIHVKQNFIDFESCYFLPLDIHKEIYRRCNPEYFDVLMVNIGAGIATTALVKVKYEFSLKNVALLKPNKKVLSGSFLNYHQEYVKNNIVSGISSGGAQPFLSLGQIGNLQIRVPSLSEQTAIANALADTDALISSIEKLIAKKRNIKQAAMQKLLQSKEGWGESKLGDYLDYEQPTNYIVKDDEYNANNMVPVLTAGKTFILGYTSEEFGWFTKLPVIIFDDFTTASKYVNFSFKVKSSAMKMLIPKKQDINLKFIYELMQQIRYSLGDHKRHWIGEYQNIKVLVPSPEEQNKIATILSDMDAEISALEAKMEKYKQIKQGMMQNLLTGKIRLV